MTTVPYAELPALHHRMPVVLPAISYADPAYKYPSVSHENVENHSQ